MPVELVIDVCHTNHATVTITAISLKNTVKV